MTAYSLFYGWKCRGRAFEFRVVAAFLPKRSWVKAAIRSDTAESRRALRHEQTHFDIAEVYARRMRKHFGELAEPCKLPDGELDAMTDRFVNEERKTQERYDRETTHGLEAQRQGAWEQEVAGLLASLTRYAQ